MKKIITLAIAALFVFSAFTVMIGTEADADDVPDTNWKDYEFTDADKAWYDTTPTATTFKIKTAAELAYFSVLVAGVDNFDANTISFEPSDGKVDLSAHQWTPIGTHHAGFHGTFNGNGNTISGIIIVTGEDDGEYIGLFGESEGIIHDLKITDSVIDSGMFVGLVVGLNIGYLSNCSVTDSTVKGNQMVGGLVGHNQGGIEDSYNTGNVEAAMRSVGGIAGQNDDSISDCYNAGDITGPAMVGGIAGSSLVIDGSGEIIDCYNTGTVGKGGQGNEASIGGITGKSDGLVQGCYNTGDVEDGAPIIGVNDGATEELCYWLTKSDGDGGLTQNEMTGGEALNNMPDLRDFTWVAKENKGKLSYLPQLVAFTTNSNDPIVQADSLKSVTIDERTPIELTWSQVPYVFERGQMLSDIAADKYVTASQAGAIAWAEPDKVLTDAGDFTAAVEYTDDTGYYLPNEVEVSITVYVPTYTVTVTGGTASPVLGETGTVVTLTPGAAPEGQQFKSWNITEAGGGSISGNSFTIGTADATITAVWEDIPEPIDRNNNSEETMMVIAGVIVAVLIAALCVVHFRKD